MSAQDTFHHVRDFDHFELPFGGHIDLPAIGDFQITKFMVLQVVAAAIVFFVYRGLAKNIAGGKPATGRFWNFWEAIALFIRDEVVRPTIGYPHHDHHGEEGHADEDWHHSMHEHEGEISHPADKFLPFIWSCFFYILVCNLLGAIPFLGSATGNINVTVPLALCAFRMTILAGVGQSGPTGFLASLCPTMDLSPGLKLVLVPMIWVIEFVGFFIKHGVLAIRLFANIMGGHTVLGVMLMFISMTAQSGLWYVVTPASIAGQIGIGLLELLVAFIQAYVFTMLATLFISASVNPH